ncbi:MAG: DUF421 domain-containing protein [Clostridiales bacterium]|nr:DUF421 domain-containing protein [Clostridiales bacterium]
MLIILLRTAILYIVALFVIRIMGKGELSKLDPFQMVVLFMIAELATLPLESTDIPIFNGVTAMLTLLFLQVLTAVLSKKSQKIARILSGRPAILIQKGEINERELERLQLSITDLAEYLRIKNYPLFSDVEYAILEANGELSVIPRPEKRPVTPEDLDIVLEREELPVTLIADGQLSKRGLRIADIKEKTLLRAMRKAGARDYRDVLFAFSDEHREIHIHLKEEKKKTERKKACAH